MRCYRGYRDDRDRAVVEVFDDRRPEATVPLHHHRKHSPAGFEWGYLGSGPADLARCLLIDHLGERAWCSACEGTGIMGPAHRMGGALDPDQCWVCLGEATAFQPSVYQSLKFETVSTWGDTWELSDAHLRSFLARFDPDPGPGVLHLRGVTVLGPRLNAGGMGS